MKPKNIMKTREKANGMCMTDKSRKPERVQNRSTLSDPTIR